MFAFYIKKKKKEEKKKDKIFVLCRQLSGIKE